MADEYEAVQLKATNDRAAARELAELRRVTVKGLRYALEVSGVDSVIDLLAESNTLCPVLDEYVDNGATVDGLRFRERTTQDIEAMCNGCGWDFSGEPEQVAKAKEIGFCPNCARPLRGRPSGDAS